MLIMLLIQFYFWKDRWCLLPEHTGSYTEWVYIDDPTVDFEINIFQSLAS